MVKELLSQHLLFTTLTEPGIYLDFSMYCFYRGMYYLEKKNYFFTAYYFSVPTSLYKIEKASLINDFTIQMLKSLYFLKILSDFDIVSIFLRREGRGGNMFREECIGKKELDQLIELIKSSSPITLEHFASFCSQYGEEIKKSKLTGLKQAAEEELRFKEIQEQLINYKRISLSKLVTELKRDYNDCLFILKKKVIEGRIKIKFDEEENIIEVIDATPRNKKQAEESQKLYQILLESNKNLFVYLKNRQEKAIELEKLPADEKLMELKQEEAFENDMDIEDQLEF